MEKFDVIMIIGFVCAAVLITLFVWHQRTKVVQWLVWAVSEAEKKIGKKTGQLKLYTVYAWFCKEFPKFAAVVPFSWFSSWVDIALKTMKAWIDSGSPIAQYITGRDGKDNG